MQRTFTKEWLHIAGNSSRVESRQPPYWRLRLEQTQKVFDLNALDVSGSATAFNNRQGVHQGASFLLWWAIFGDVKITTTDNFTNASITLRSHPPTTSSIFNQTNYETYSFGRDTWLNIYAAADRARIGGHLRWRINANFPADKDIATWVLLGQIYPASFSLGENVRSRDHQRRLWLSFKTKHIKIDNINNAIVHI